MPSNIPIAPKPPKHKTAPPASHSSSTSSSSSGSRSGGSSGNHRSGGGGGSSSSVSAYERRQNAKEKKAQHKAAQRYLTAASDLRGQIKALQVALGPRGFKHALDVKLANINLGQLQQDRALMSDYDERVDNLGQMATDNEKAADATTVANLANRANERRQALTEAMNNGAGESDVLKAQEASLRNWSANQSEANRSFFDTLSSINSSLTDLTVDTRTARMNNVVQANADRDQAYTNYFDQRSETYTQLGNVRGQQAEYYGQAQEMEGSRRTRRLHHQASQQSAHNFLQASHASGQAWRSPGVSASITGWKGADDFEGALNNGGVASAGHATDIKRPEGATLRKWDT